MEMTNKLLRELIAEVRALRGELMRQRPVSCSARALDVVEQITGKSTGLDGLAAVWRRKQRQAASVRWERPK